MVYSLQRLQQELKVKEMDARKTHADPLAFARELMGKLEILKLKTEPQGNSLVLPNLPQEPDDSDNILDQHVHRVAKNKTPDSQGSLCTSPQPPIRQQTITMAAAGHIQSHGLQSLITPARAGKITGSSTGTSAVTGRNDRDISIRSGWPQNQMVQPHSLMTQNPRQMPGTFGLSFILKNFSKDRVEHKIMDYSNEMLSLNLNGFLLRGAWEQSKEPGDLEK